MNIFNIGFKKNIPRFIPNPGMTREKKKSPNFIKIKTTEKTKKKEWETRNITAYERYRVN